LASTSLLEGLVWGVRSARHIKDEFQNETDQPTRYYADVPAWQDEGLMDETDPALVRQDWMTIKTTMWNYAGIVRSHRRLERAKADLSYLSHRIEQFYRETKLTDQLIGLRNGLQVAENIVHAALRNTESRGSHFRKN
jgi:L-aspartate oxidase